MNVTQGSASGKHADHDARWQSLVAPADYRPPQPAGRYHVVVIGAGPAGLVTAIAAAGLGAKVALVERHRMGGDCLNVGCVPSKALLEITSGSEIGFAEAFDWLRRVRADIAAHDSVARFSEAGVDVFLGQARFIDEATIAVDEIELNARRVVIATGARPAVPPIPGLSTAQPLTNETVFSLKQQPRRLAILGAGPIGCELAQAFARLDTEVHLFEAASRILSRESESAAEAVASGLRSAGVTLHVGKKVERVETRGTQTVIATEDQACPVDRILVAAGRLPNTDELNLAAVDVQTDDRGLIVVDQHLRTTNHRIFAAGDVCSKLQFTHNADAQARVVVQNALFLPTAKYDSRFVPRCTYTTPEVAQIGPTRDELELEGAHFDSYQVRYGELDRGRTQGDTDGYIEILTEPGSSRIIAATIVGHDAGEQLGPVCVAVANGLGIDQLGKAQFAYPTRVEAFRRIADQYNRKRLTPMTRSLFARWFRWTG